jgi:hypothetical protein
VIALLAVLAVALLVADRYVIAPVLESGQELEAERQRVVGELERATLLFERRRLMARRWQEMTEGGLSADPSRAEQRVLHALRDWAQAEGLSLASLRPDRMDGEDGVGEVTVAVAGTGTMRAVARFLYRVERTELPLRVRELQLGSRTEGEDDLSLQLKLSTLYRAAGGEPAPAGSGESP